MDHLKLTLFRRRIHQNGEFSLWEQVADPEANQEPGWEYRYFLG